MKTLVASLSLAVLMSGVAVPAAGAPVMAPHAVLGAHRGCSKLFTVAMATRAARRVYGGAHSVPISARRHLHRYMACQRNPRARWYVHRYYRQQAYQRYLRLHPPMYEATASWYSDASGRCASPSGCSYYGVANLSLGFGTRVRFCYPYWSHRCVDAVVDDRGPYVGGREWDLNQNVAGALGFGGVGTVGYHIY